MVGISVFCVLECVCKCASSLGSRGKKKQSFKSSTCK